MLLKGHQGLRCDFLLPLAHNPMLRNALPELTVPYDRTLYASCQGKAPWSGRITPFPYHLYLDNNRLGGETHYSHLYNDYSGIALDQIWHRNLNEMTLVSIINVNTINSISAQFAVLMKATVEVWIHSPLMNHAPNCYHQPTKVQEASNHLLPTERHSHVVILTAS